MKEKTYVFRHHRFMVGFGMTEDGLKNEATQAELRRGYYPAQMRIERVMANAMTTSGYPVMDYRSAELPKEYLVANWWSAFMGKKVALKEYEKQPNMMFPNVISLMPTNLMTKKKGRKKSRY